MSSPVEGSSRIEGTRNSPGDTVIYSGDPADFYYVGVNIPCQNACPALTNIPGYIRCVHEGRNARSYDLNRIANLFPGVLGRICSRPCETKCRHGEPELGKPVAICHIKRSAADFREPLSEKMEPIHPSRGKSVCIVGAGPAGLAAAYDLAMTGFEVTVLEALDHPGGMLRYGIPEFRLPREVLSGEVQWVLDHGVTLRTGVRVGKDVSVDELLSTYHAVLIAAGCYESKPLDVPGETLPGVYTGLSFVMDIASGSTPAMGNDTLVIGAGFTAFDCSRLALRYGSKNVSICLRATEHDLRVTEEEIFETKREGVKLRGLVISKRVVGTNRVEGVEFVRTKPVEILPNGRRRVVPIEGSEFIVSCDSVIVAVGQGALAIPAPGEKNDRGIIRANGETFRSSEPNLYVAGDFMTGPTTVIEAIASGRKAAQKIAEDLTDRRFAQWAVKMQVGEITDRLRSWDFIPRMEMSTLLPVESRFSSRSREVEQGLSKELSVEEAKRCYLCYLHYEIDVSKCIYCRYCIDVAPRDCIKLVKRVITNEDGAVTGFVETTKWKDVNAIIIDNSRCIRCGECVRVCPVDCISVSKVELVQQNLQGGRN